MMEKKKVTIYTDGACSYNPGPGGWGCILIYEATKKELSGGMPNTTNNRMEMMAAIMGLSALKQPCEVNLHTDSAYLLNAFEKKWIFSWQKNNWVKSDKKPVLNVDLWKQLIELCNIHDVHFVKVKGHANDELNNRCDELARAESKKIK